MEKFVIKTEADLLKKMEMCNTMMGIVIAHTIEKRGKENPRLDWLPIQQTLSTRISNARLRL